MTDARGAGREAIFEIDLHGYIDGELPAQRRAEVEYYLATHPNHAARSAEFRALTLSLHRLYGGSPPMNPRIEALTADLDRALRRRIRTRRLMRIVAGMLVLAVGGGIALSLYGRLGLGAVEDRVLAVTRQAADAHVLFAGERSLPQQDAGRPEDPAAVAWLSERLTGAPLRTPDLRALGYELTMERILPSANGPAAQLMYESSEAEQPVTLFISEGEDAKPISFTYVRNADLSVFYWQEGPLTYSLAGNLDRAALLSLAEEVNTQLAASPPSQKSLVQRRVPALDVSAPMPNAEPRSDASSVEATDAAKDRTPQEAPDSAGARDDGAAAQPAATPAPESTPAGTTGGAAKKT